MLLENRVYRLAKWADGWKCEQVTDAESAIDLAYCVGNNLPYRFTIRRFANGVMFMLYSPHATHDQINAQAARMVKHPAP